MFCSILPCVVLCYIVRCCVVVSCIVLVFVIVLCCLILSCALCDVLRSLVLSCAVLCCIVQPLSWQIVYDVIDLFQRLHVGFHALKTDHQIPVQQGVQSILFDQFIR